MRPHAAPQIRASRAAAAFYRRAIGELTSKQIPFLIGGAYAMEWYTTIPHRTKDLDILVRPGDCQRVLAALESAGYETKLPFPHWLGKVFCGREFIDVIFNAGNGIIPVDDSWFEHAVSGEILGMPAKICSPVELIWSKAFVMERERFDGADVAHLLRSCSDELDWPRVLRRFGSNWPVLFSHLILFGFIYPTEKSCIPEWVMRILLRRLDESTDESHTERVCQGTLLSREQYLIDIQAWGYEDARLQPRGKMTQEEIACWTEAIAAHRSNVTPLSRDPLLRQVDPPHPAQTGQ